MLEEEYFLKQFDICLKQEIKKCNYCKFWIENENPEMILFKKKRLYFHKYCLEKINILI